MKRLNSHQPKTLRFSPWSFSSVLTFLGLTGLAVAWAIPDGESHEIPRDKHRQFADALTENLYENDNDCSSSLGLSMLFDLLRPGASENTRTEMCNVIGLCSPEELQQQLRVETKSADELLWNRTVERITSKYDGSCQYEGYGDDDNASCEQWVPTIKVANSVWVHMEATVDPSYLAIVGDFLTQIDFSDELAAQTVNDWVNTSTLGLIDSILTDGPVPGKLCAVNSIYFNAGWRHFFSESKTNEDLFYTDPSRTTPLATKAHFMHMASPYDYPMFPYSADAIPGYQIVELPYQGNGLLSMIIVLPMMAEKDSVSSLDVAAARQKLTSQRIAMAIPKFQFDTSYQNAQLNVALEAIGLTTPFSLAPGEGFCGMIADQCLAISLIIQKTAIHVNERGTVAAAVSAAVLDGWSPPEEVDVKPILFQADHPFQFFICDFDEDVCLFEGRVGDPEIPPSSVAPLESVHTDKDFWTTNFNVNISVEEERTISNSTPPDLNSTQKPISSPTQSPDSTKGDSATRSAVHMVVPVAFVLWAIWV